MKAASFWLLTLSACSPVWADKIREFWFDGAEISTYELDQFRYGENHPGYAEFIFVTEPFLVSEQVKHEYGSGDSVDVLKLNAFRTFNTGIYSYRTMTSTFQPIDLNTYPYPLKTNTSIQEWCGQAYQQLNYRDEGWDLELRSYFQNFGDEDERLPSAWLEDGIWILLRLDPNELPQGDFTMIPGTIFSRFKHETVKPQKASGTLLKNGETSSYEIVYSKIDRTLRIEFDTEFPHTIRAWTEKSQSGETSAKLKKSITKSYYWSQNRPEDRKLRRKLGLQQIAD